MPLTRPFPIDSAFPNPIDLRKQASGIYPREGIFPDPVTIAAAGIAYANGGWNVGARPFVANVKRGGAAFTQAYGSAQITNDSAATAWTIGAAPASGTRVDRLWIRATDPGQGEALTGGIAVPVFGVTAGTPGLAALPAGAVEIAQVSVPAGAASIANATITQTYNFANVIGATIYVRTLADRDALAPVMDGESVYVVTTKALYLRRNGAWVTSYNDTGWLAITLAASATVADGLTPKIRLRNDTVFLTGRVLQGASTIAQLTSEYWPHQDMRVLAATGNSGAGAAALVMTSAGSLYTAAGTTVNLAALGSWAVN